jgi:hypothetical protein
MVKIIAISQNVTTFARSDIQGSIDGTGMAASFIISKA